MASKITVVLPDGTIGKRETKRPYEFVLAVGPRRREHAINSIQHAIDRQLAEAQRYNNTINHLRTVEIVDMSAINHGNRFVTSKWAIRIERKDARSGWEQDNLLSTFFSKADDMETARAEEIQQYEEFAASCRDRAAKYEAQRDEVAAGPELIGTWGVVSWHHRKDLALKALAEKDMTYGEYKIIELGEAA